ncbi:MAG: PQQ-binding-like beta-propeller repeat protein, partial [Planctomycetota bacterium]
VRMMQFSCGWTGPIVAGLICLVSGGTAGAGPMQSWEQGGGDAGRSGYAGGSINATQIELAWTAPLGFVQSGTGSWDNRAVATDGRYVYRTALEGYAPSGDYHVMAFDLHTGSEAWRTTLKGRAFEGVSEPVVANGKVWVQRAGHSGLSGSTDADRPALYGLSAVDGSVVSSTFFEAQWGESERPAVDNGLLVGMAGYYGGVAGYDTATGEQRWWHYGPQLENPRPLLTENHYITYDSVLRNRDDGSLVGDLATGARPNLELTTVSPNGQVLGRSNAAAQGTHVVAYDDQNFEETWATDVGAYINAVYAGDDVVLAITNVGVTLLDATSGELQWQVERPGPLRTQEGAVSDTHFFVTGTDTTYAINLIDGSVDWVIDDAGELALGDGYLFLSDRASIRAYSVVPEPATLTGLSLAGLLVLRRRR